MLIADAIKIDGGSASPSGQAGACCSVVGPGDCWAYLHQAGHAHKI